MSSEGLQHRVVAPAHMLNLIAGKEGEGFGDSVISTDKLVLWRYCSGFTSFNEKMHLFSCL
jgi:hypothetical protein